MANLEMGILTNGLYVARVCVNTNTGDQYGEGYLATVTEPLSSDFEQLYEKIHGEKIPSNETHVFWVNSRSQVAFEKNKQIICFLANTPDFDVAVFDAMNGDELMSVGFEDDDLAKICGGVEFVSLEHVSEDSSRPAANPKTLN